MVVPGSILWTSFISDGMKFVSGKMTSSWNPRITPVM